MRNLDFSSWNGLLTTLIGLVLVSVVAVGIRLVFMQTIQRRRERENRQINERLRTLIAAYKTLGGSFTGDLAVDPTHLRALRRGAAAAASGTAAADAPGAQPVGGIEPIEADTPASMGPGESLAERRRRTRDAVEAALSDIVLLGTEEQVRLAVHAANEMVEGRRVELKALVVSLRDFIRNALDLEPIPADLRVPDQGPVRPGGTGGRTGPGAADRAGGGGGRGGGGGGGGAGMGLGMGMGAGAGGMAVGAHASDEAAALSGDVQTK